MSSPRVVDSHVHFWNSAGPSSLRIPWLDEHPALVGKFLAEQFAAHDPNVDAIVFVEANVAAGLEDAELDFVDQLATRDPRIIGRVAAVDFQDETEIDDTLARYAARTRVVGVRQNIQGRPAGYCLTPAFVRGVRAAGAHGFAFDLCITAGQLDDATSLVRQCPETRFVLDHCGKPSIRSDQRTAWAAGIARLAGLDNVGCKISGLLTEARPDQRNAEALRPYVDHVRKCFGPTRILYGSDWPVSTLAPAESSWRAIVDTLSGEWSDADRQLFYADNAMRHYQLEAQ